MATTLGERPGQREAAVTRTGAAASRADEKGSAGLAVRGVLLAARAELGQLEPVGVVAAVLLGDVVALLALRARQGDLGADVGGLGLGGNLLSEKVNRSKGVGPAHEGSRDTSTTGYAASGIPRNRDLGSGSGARSRDLTIMSRAL